MKRKPTEKKYVAKEIFSETEATKLSENPDESSDALDTSSSEDKTIEDSSSAIEADSIDKDKEAGKNE